MADLHSTLDTIDLPAAPVPKRADREPDLGEDKKLVVVGAQITEFSSAVSAPLRPVLSQGLLLGQLAADKAMAAAGAPNATGAPGATGGTGDVRVWYDTFGAVLKKIGWFMTDLEFDEQTTSHSNAEVHEAIMPIVTLMLGPQAAAASLVIAVLKGMETMKKDTPWLTLFERRSQTFTGAKFQISYIDAGPGGGITLKTAFFGIEAKQAITQVLFFKTSVQGATIRKASSTLLLDSTLLQDLAAPLKAKVGPFIAQNIREIDIDL